MPEKQIPLIDGPTVFAPGLAVLWHYADDPAHADGRRDRWTCVGIYGDDESKQASDESLRERPAMEPGHAVVMSLSALSLVRHDAAPGSHPTPEQRPALEGHCECGWKLIGPHDGDQWCTRCTPPGSHPTPEEDRIMQITANTLHVLVGESKTPITLTDSAVVAVQDEASGNLVGYLEVIGAEFEALADSPADWTGETLLGLRDAFQRGLESIDILIDCRPLEEFEGSPDA